MAYSLILSVSVLPISYSSYTGFLAVPWAFAPAPLSGVFYAQIFVLSFTYFRSLFKCHLLKGDSSSHLVKYS